jgi:hypothetical protein
MMAKRQLPAKKVSAADRLGTKLVTLRGMANHDEVFKKVLDSYEKDPNPIDLEIIDRLLVQKMMTTQMEPRELAAIATVIGQNRERMVKIDAAGTQYQVETRFREFMKSFLQRWNELLRDYLEEEDIYELLKQAALYAQDVVDKSRDDLAKSSPHAKKAAGLQTPTVIDMSAVSRVKPGGNHKVGTPQRKTGKPKHYAHKQAPKDANTGMPDKED